MARQVLTLGGTLIGAYFGVPQLGMLIGSALGNAVDPVKIEGPRLTDAKAMTARDGVPIPWGDGIFRVAGTMIACQPGKPTEHKTKKRQGKGGGPVQVTYTYTRSHAVLVCEGPIIGIRRIWRNGKLVYDQTPLPTSADEPDPTSLAALIRIAIKSKASSAKFADKLTIYLGDETQLPDPTLEAMFGTGEVGANRGIAYVVIEDDDVTDSGGAVPQYEFEVARAGVVAADSPYYSEDGFLLELAGTSNAGPTAGTTSGYVLTGLSETDTVVLYPIGTADGLGAVYTAWSPFDGTPGTPPEPWTNQTRVTTTDGDTLYYDTFFSSAALSLAAAKTTGSIVLTGYTDYEIGLQDSPTYDNRGGLSFWAQIIPSSSELPDAPGYRVTDTGDVVPTGELGETIAEDTPSVAEMISTICLRCGLGAIDIDVTDVSAIDLTGYVIARPADGSACLNPLLDAFQVGMYEADGKIWFVQLGAATVADVDADDLVAQEGPPVTEVRSQEVELPRKINVLYADPATAYTVTKQTSERTASTVSAVGERNIELPVVMTADQAAQIAHKKEKAAWIELLGGKDFALPDEFSYLTPTDNINLTYRGRTERLRIEKVDGEGGKLMLSTRQDRQSAYSSDRTGTNPSDFISADTLVGPTIWNVMNLPQLRPQDNVPGVYFACCGILTGWRGCELQMSVDSGVSWISMLQVDQPNAIGYVETAMLSGDTTARVLMYGTNELESVTTAQVDAGSNRAAIVTSADVCELVSFEDAVLDTGTTYDLATMVRGLSQTTAAAHAVNERFVQLDSVNFVPIPLEFSGQTIIFRAVSLGTIESNNGEQTLVFSPGIQVIDGGGA